MEHGTQKVIKVTLTKYISARWPTRGNHADLFSYLFSPLCLRS